MYLNFKGTVVELSKGMNDVSEERNIASCLEPVTVNYVSVWFCASRVETTVLL